MRGSGGLLQEDVEGRVEFRTGRAVGEKHLGPGRIGTKEGHPLKHSGREIHQGRGRMSGGWAGGGKPLQVVGGGVMW